MTTITVKPRARPIESHTTPAGGYQTPKWRGFAVYCRYCAGVGNTLRDAYINWHRTRYGVPPLH